MLHKKRKTKKKKVQEVCILRSALYGPGRDGVNRKILALDLAETTGWATHDHTGLCSGVWKLKKGKHPGTRWAELYGRILKEDPAVVVYEASGNWRGHAAVRCYQGWLTAVEMAAGLLDIGVVGLHANSLKKWATGNGRATKEDMILAAKRHWPEVEIIDDNHADALCLLTWAMKGVE